MTKSGYASETAKIKSFVVPLYIEESMRGLDLGFGGHRIVPTAIAMDLPYKFRNQDLHGDARSLNRFADNTLDYVYSSHLLEDFPPDQQMAVLSEWWRVIRHGGILVLNLPHEQRYRMRCSKTGQPYNANHKCSEMSSEYMLAELAKLPDLQEPPALIYEEPFDEEAHQYGYTFVVIAKKGVK